MDHETGPMALLRIGDEDRATGTGGVHDHVHPVTGKVQAQIPLAGKVEVDRAVAKAVAAFDAWRRWRPEARRDVLLKLAELMADNNEEFARLTALDGGTPFMVGRIAAKRATDWMTYYAGWADKISGEFLSTYDTRGELAYTVPEPIGVVGIIITWNGPILSLGMKVAPALAAGNCVVVKPAELTPFAPDLFMRLAREAGLPDGVISMLPGSPEAGQALVHNPAVRKISFTGGPIAARQILIDCAEQMKPAVLELGGKSASLLFPDSDIDEACHAAVYRSIGALSGQGCAFPTRLIVHESIFDEVLEKVVAAAKTLKVGDPMEEGVNVGPLINAAACDRVMGMLDRMRSEGSARVVLGGGRAGGALAGGAFIEPTVLTDVDPKSEIAQVEIFGPVLLVMKFSSEDEAITLANDTEYGLAAYIQTRDVKRVHRLAERLKTGGVYVNGANTLSPHRPFGGLGLSGYGKEGGRAGIDEFLNYKTVAVA